MRMFDKGISTDDLFKLMDRLSINDISALIAGVSPDSVNYNWDYERTDQVDKYCLNTGYNAPDNASEVFSIMLKVLTRAVIARDLNAQIVQDNQNQSLYLDDLSKDWLAIGTIDTNKTTILRDDIKKWLDDRGVYPSAFFPNGRKDDYMNPQHECYSADLALCVRAWEVAQTANYDNQTIKQFMTDWIRQNAPNHGWGNGKDPMGEKKAQELASVANWHTKGGATKGNPNLKEPTPPISEYKPIPDELKINLPPNPYSFNKKTDEEMPF